MKWKNYFGLAILFKSYALKSENNFLFINSQQIYILNCFF